MFLIGYALGQILAPQPWRQQYKPRNLIPWGVVLIALAGDFCFLVALRTYMVRENARRDRLQADRTPAQIEEERWGWVEFVGEDGKVVKRKVDKSLMDLTDRENLNFRYCL